MVRHDAGGQQAGFYLSSRQGAEGTRPILAPGVCARSCVGVCAWECTLVGVVYVLCVCAHLHSPCPHATHTHTHTLCLYTAWRTSRTRRRQRLGWTIEATRRQTSVTLVTTTRALPHQRTFRGGTARRSRTVGIMRAWSREKPWCPRWLRLRRLNSGRQRAASAWRPSTDPGRRARPRLRGVAVSFHECGAECRWWDSGASLLTP